MTYASNNYYRKGSWNVICDVCGKRHKAEDVRKRWDDLIVCKEDWEADHPQKFLRVQADGKQVPFIREEAPDTFVQVCYLSGISAYADLATADCSQADNNSFPYSGFV